MFYEEVLVKTLIIGVIIIGILGVLSIIKDNNESKICEKQGGVYFYKEYACINPKDFIKGEK